MIFLVSALSAARVNLLMNDYASGLPSPMAFLGLGAAIAPELGADRWSVRVIPVLHSVVISSGRTKPEMVPGKKPTPIDPVGNGGRHDWYGPILFGSRHSGMWERDRRSRGLDRANTRGRCYRAERNRGKTGYGAQRHITWAAAGICGGAPRVAKVENCLSWRPGISCRDCPVAVPPGAGTGLRMDGTHRCWPSAPGRSGKRFPAAEEHDPPTFPMSLRNRFWESQNWCRSEIDG